MTTGLTWQGPGDRPWEPVHAPNSSTIAGTLSTAAMTSEQFKVRLGTARNVAVVRLLTQIVADAGSARRFSPPEAAPLSVFVARRLVARPVELPYREDHWWKQDRVKYPVERQLMILGHIAISGVVDTGTNDRHLSKFRRDRLVFVGANGPSLLSVSIEMRRCETGRCLVRARGSEDRQGDRRPCFQAVVLFGHQTGRRSAG